MVEFVLQDVVEGAVSQVLTASQDKDTGVLVNQSEGFMKEKLYSDGIRLQQILSDILFVSVKFSTVGGSVEISCNLTKNRIGKSLHLELRRTYPQILPSCYICFCIRE
jgi:phytochrome A